jgi:hypothetical protein
MSQWKLINCGVDEQQAWSAWSTFIVHSAGAACLSWKSPSPSRKWRLLRFTLPWDAMHWWDSTWHLPGPNRVNWYKIFLGLKARRRLRAYLNKKWHRKKLRRSTRVWGTVTIRPIIMNICSVGGPVDIISSINVWFCCLSDFLRCAEMAIFDI